MGEFIFELAKESDEDSLQRILYDNCMEGKIKLTFQAKPSYFSALSAVGKFNQVVVARERLANNIVGFGTRSIKPMYINGKERDFGYLNHLRLNKAYRGGTLVARGYQFLKELHQDKRTPGYLTTIVEDNKYAKDILTRKRAGLPRYQDMGLYYSIAIPICGKKINVKFNLEIHRGSETNIDEIIKFINKVGSQRQFYPVYTREDFVSQNGFLRGFHPEDFYLAFRNNKLVGVLGRWDQRNFKQAVILDYSRGIKLIRPIYNLSARIISYPLLPNPESTLNFFSVCFIAIDSNDIGVFRELLWFLHNDYVGRGYAYFLVGLHSLDPLLKAARDFATIRYKSRLYLVYWQEDKSFFESLDNNRIPYLEISSL